MVIWGWPLTLNALDTLATSLLVKNLDCLISGEAMQRPGIMIELVWGFARGGRKDQRRDFSKSKASLFTPFSLYRLFSYLYSILFFLSTSRLITFPLCRHGKVTESVSLACWELPPRRGGDHTNLTHMKMSPTRGELLGMPGSRLHRVKSHELGNYAKRHDGQLEG
jgi:hypothetical protein